MKNNTILLGALLVSFLPVWRSGGKAGLNFWEFVINHTVYGDPVEYLPQEQYEELV